MEHFDFAGTRELREIYWPAVADFGRHFIAGGHGGNCGKELAGMDQQGFQLGIASVNLANDDFVVFMLLVHFPAASGAVNFVECVRVAQLKFSHRGAAE